jgi:hypothetical protein
MTGTLTAQRGNLFPITMAMYNRTLLRQPWRARRAWWRTEWKSLSAHSCRAALPQDVQVARCGGRCCSIVAFIDGSRRCFGGCSLFVLEMLFILAGRDRCRLVSGGFCYTNFLSWWWFGSAGATGESLTQQLRRCQQQWRRRASFTPFEAFVVLAFCEVSDLRAKIFPTCRIVVTASSMSHPYWRCAVVLSFVA